MSEKSVSRLIELKMSHAAVRTSSRLHAAIPPLRIRKFSTNLSSNARSSVVRECSMYDEIYSTGRLKVTSNTFDWRQDLSRRFRPLTTKTCNRRTFSTVERYNNDKPSRDEFERGLAGESFESLLSPVIIMGNLEGEKIFEEQWCSNSTYGQKPTKLVIIMADYCLLYLHYWAIILSLQVKDIDSINENRRKKAIHGCMEAVSYAEYYNSDEDRTRHEWEREVLKPG
ncbi:hypothetical protein L218DRAFT_944271 [Marasmius fiardii PR-910]|nr:hypothetical protein L218DRAFT_944271 [Marasmius fiardii PR-910]